MDNNRRPHKPTICAIYDSSRMRMERKGWILPDENHLIKSGIPIEWSILRSMWATETVKHKNVYCERLCFWHIMKFRGDRITIAWAIWLRETMWRQQFIHTFSIQREEKTISNRFNESKRIQSNSIESIEIWISFLYPYWMFQLIPYYWNACAYVSLCALTVN